MISQHTLLFRLVGPLQSWGYRSRFEDRDTGLEPTRSGVLGLLASACGVSRSDTRTLEYWDRVLRIGVRSDRPAIRRRNSPPDEKTGFRVQTDFHTAQNVLRASGEGSAETTLSRRHYLTDARFTVGVESGELGLLRQFEAGLRDPFWTLFLGRRAFPLSLPPLIPDGSVRENTSLLAALRAAPYPLLTPREQIPAHLTFVLEAASPFEGIAAEIPSEAVPMRLNDRPLNFESEARRYGLRQVYLFQLARDQCPLKEERCFSAD
ncbi:MAG: type I-E CRISPR-associated protein Cas5/CasD [Candidatus Hadarchaeum sp.]